MNTVNSMVRTTTNVSNIPTYGMLRELRSDHAAVASSARFNTANAIAMPLSRGSFSNSHQWVSTGSISVRGRSHMSSAHSAGSTT